jgi:DNA-directed RNA polymerase II subunit RPB1
MKMLRLLTTKEIEDMLAFIKPQPAIPLDTAMSVVNMNKAGLRRQLQKQKIYPKMIGQLKAEIKKSYRSSMIPAGESVGVICAQSIGERQTQTTLNTFHRAGQSEKTMTSGVPRFQELINATKKPRNVNHRIYFKDNHSTVQKLRDTVNHTIVGMTFSDISTSISTQLDKEDETWYEAYTILHNGAFREYSHCISIKLNMNKIFEFKISIQKLADFISSEYDDLHCVVSPPGMGQLDVFVDCSSMELPEERILFVDSSNAVVIYLEECVQPVLENMNLCGIPGITEVFYVRDGTEWLVETNGVNSRSIRTNFVNFKELLALASVDECRTISNNVWDIYEVLGIEAARQFLIEEFMNILEGINYCHPYLLVDRMTHAGSISSITRYTMKKDTCGPFGKASFEETMDNFLNAAARGEIEPTKGVSASIICGKRAMIGTGMIGIKTDLANLPQGRPLCCSPFKPKSKAEDCSKELEIEMKMMEI